MLNSYGFPFVVGLPLLLGVIVNPCGGIDNIFTNDVGPVVSTLETIDLCQVLINLRDNSRSHTPFEPLIPGHSSPCPLFPTLPEAAAAFLPSGGDSPCGIVF